MILIPNDEIISPRLLKLIRDLEEAESKRKVLDNFWNEIKESGTPIIETIESKPNHKLVTFLYKENTETDEILLYSNSLGSIPHRGKFVRIQGTDVYYKSIFYLNKTRTTYAITRQKAIIPLYSTNDFSLPTLEGDPLNKKNFNWLPGLTLATLELPDVPPQPWIEQKENIPKGKLKNISLKSTKFEEKFSIKVYLPPNYDVSRGPFGSLFLFDGFMYTTPTQIPTPTILDNLIFSKKIPPIISIFIFNRIDEGLVTRSNELNTNPDFAFFVGEELFPYIKEKYNISSDSRETVVGGASLGGLSASYMGLKYPDKFGKILSQSGSYWAPKKLIEDIDPHFRKWQYLIGEYMKKDKLPLEFYIEIGVYEGMEALHGAPSHFFSNRYFRDVLLSKGYPVKYVEYIGGHDFICWRGSLADGLIYLIGKSA